MDTPIGCWWEMDEPYISRKKRKRKNKRKCNTSYNLKEENLK
jgi:hypothetical protein